VKRWTGLRERGGETKKVSSWRVCDSGLTEPS
jgi:hypothetical protein